MGHYQLHITTIYFSRVDGAARLSTSVASFGTEGLAYIAEQNLMASGSSSMGYVIVRLY